MALHDRDQYVFKETLYPQSLLSRGVLYAKLIPNDSRQIHIFNTQLQPVSKDANSKLVRMKQLHELVKFMKKKTQGDDHPIILCGDFGINALEKAETVVDEEFWETGDTEEIGLKDAIKYIEEKSDEYIHLVDLLTDIGTVSDVIYNGLGRHPVTVGDTKYDGQTEIALETVLTSSIDQYSKRSQDFIFTITRKDDLAVNHPALHTYDVNDESIHFLSSHYGLSCEVQC